MSMIEGETARPRLVQQGPLPLYFVTGLATMDVDLEFVVMTFCADQRWGGFAPQECELLFRMAVPISRMAGMRAQVAAKLGLIAAAH